MRLLKRVFPILLALTLCLLVLPASADEINVQNADFELTEDGLPPAMWTLDAYKIEECTFSAETGYYYSGKVCAKLANLSPNDSRLEQKINCLPNRYYCFSAYVLAENVGEESTGVNLTVQGDGKLKYNNTVISADVKGTSEEWQKLELYVQTGPNVNALYLWLRLGAYGSDNTGAAFFDQVQFREVSELPDGAVVSTVGLGNDEPEQNNENSGSETHNKLSFGDLYPLILILSAIAILLFLIFFKNGGKNATDKNASSTKPETKQYDASDDDI